MEGSADPAAAQPAVDLDKEAKKKAKQAEKEAKKLKALQKQQAKEAAAKSGAGAAAEKKAREKAEKEAKRQAEADELARIIQLAQATGRGQKKDPAIPMAKSYSPAAVEAAWYDWWQEMGFFKPEMDSKKEPFVIVIPPPNVTGALHIGHALTNAIQDTIVRWRRMSGYNCLWVPGTDHAGISTQTVVEKKLKRDQGLTRHDLGREGFLEEVYKWVAEYGGRICQQLRRIGSSVDWDRQRFTMDEDMCKAVLEAFVRMYEKGLIYRQNRLVNWCCTLKTAISDIEVDYIDIAGMEMLTVPGYEEKIEFGVLTSFAYPLEDGSGEIVVATTRPETMLGDTAVAVHPEDERYKHLHGKFVVHPVDGRKVPIITDAELVDMSFGTGAVKITPAHDPNDFLTGQRHNLQSINVFDDKGCINSRGGQFAGQKRFQTRVTIVDFLKEKGLFRGTAANPMRLGLCSRSKDVIEPILKPQWWVNCKKMGAAACQAVRTKDLEIIPSEFEAVWFRWLENIRDWCISRQLWWGHRIPAYYVILDDEPQAEAGSPGGPSERTDRWVVGRTIEEASAQAAERYGSRSFQLVQDEDVLDTWFSSGLFPFSVMKWPQNTADLQQFYPGALLETGHDILFFWVARMVMMGLTLTDSVPFKQVYLHAMVRDAHGRKMSKSLGNVIDPIHVIEGISLQGLHDTLRTGNLDEKEVKRAEDCQKTDFPEGIAECGTDALRFALVAYTTQARDINLDILRVVAYRQWCNKLWNAIKFAMMNLPAGFQPAMDLDVAAMPAMCRWILSELNAAVARTVAAMEAYEVSKATTAIHSFWQYKVCDVFIELMKPVMAAEPGSAIGQGQRGVQETLWLCLDSGLRLLHPFMPFVTEELWQRLPRRIDQAGIPSIMIAPYPAPAPAWANRQLEQDFAYLQLLVTRTRALKGNYGLAARDKPRTTIRCSSDAVADLLERSRLEVCTLAGIDSLAIIRSGSGADQESPAGCGVAVVDEMTTVHLHLLDLKGWEPKAEAAKLEKRSKDLQTQLEKLVKQMALASYQEKVPPSVKEDNLAKKEQMETEISTIAQTVGELSKMATS